MSVLERSVVEMDNLINQELTKLANMKFRDFQSTGSFLFLYDAYSEVLEPAFDSQHRRYQDLGCVSTSGATSGDRAGIATIAFDEKYGFSNNPHCDPRLGAVAQLQRVEYGIPGSMMAVRLDSETEPVGVVVVYASDVLDIGTNQEKEALEILESATARLQFLLHQRRAITAERDVKRYADLVFDSLNPSSRGLSIKQVTEKATERISSLFGAMTAYIRIAELGKAPKWYPNVNDEDAVKALEDLVQWKNDQTSVVLNRELVEPTIHKTLSCFGDRLAWCRVTLSTEIGNLSCVLPRNVDYFSDHWTKSDVTLLERSLELLAFRLRRASDFDRLLENMDNSSDDYTKQQFNFWCYLLYDYFGIDQVLVTKVCRKPTHYKVKTQLASGFGECEPFLYKYPKDYRPSQEELGELPDIMVRILSDFIENRPEARQVYIANCNEPRNDRFCIDERLIQECNLRGRILFLPCYTIDGTDNWEDLKSILHLGSSTDQLQVSEEQYPLLMSLGRRVAEWLSAEDQRKADCFMKKIRDNGESSLKAMEKTCNGLAEITHSRGCTFFVNALNLRLLGIGGPTPEDLEQCFIKLFLAFDEWSTILTEMEIDKIIQMLAKFMGISCNATKKVLASPDTNELARIVTHVSYVLVAKAVPNVKDASVTGVHDLCGLAAKRENLSVNEVAQAFGKYLCENVYLPGYGLTGWVLRYHKSLCLPDKHPNTIKETFDADQALGEPIWRQVIIEALGFMGVTSDDSFLLSDPYQLPEHANHVPEHKDSSGPNDSFLAHPVEGFGFSELPAGVIRVSGASTMRQQFGLGDEDTVAAVSRHVANVLRSEHMRQKSYLESVLTERGDDADFRHMFARLDEGIGRIKELVENIDTSIKDEDTLAITVARLEELCDKALAIDDQRAIALNIRSSYQERFSIHDLSDGLAHWLNAARLWPDISIEKQGSKGIAKNKIVYAFRTTEEIVRNLRRHQSVQKPHVWITKGGVIYVSKSMPSDVLQKCRNWEHYHRLHQTKGGGAKVLQDAYLSADVLVEYAVPYDTSDLSEMVVRITLSSAKKAHI